MLTLAHSALFCRDRCVHSYSTPDIELLPHWPTEYPPSSMAHTAPITALASLVDTPSFLAGVALAFGVLLAWNVAVRAAHATSSSSTSPAAQLCELIRQRQPESGRRGAAVALVGAGPGAPDLLTLAAVEALSRADLVITDRIASPELMAIIPRHAVVRVSDKTPGKDADVAQDSLNEWGIDALRAGRRVVRLKVGDPFLFGRGGEEVAFYRSHGFEPDVIPGVSSALAAATVAGIPVTHRGSASSVLITTGMGRGGEFPPLPPYDAERTLVLLMAVKRLPALADDLGRVGYPLDVPVAIVERATQSDERVTCAPLSGIAAAAAAAGVTSPAVVIVGFVVNVRSATVVASAALSGGASSSSSSGDSSSSSGVGSGEPLFYSKRVD